MTTTTTATPSPEPWRPTRSYTPQERNRILRAMGRELGPVDLLELTLDTLGKWYSDAPHDAKAKALLILKRIDLELQTLASELRKSIPDRPQPRKAKR